RRRYEVYGELWRRLPCRAGGLAGAARHGAGPGVPVEPAGRHQAHQQPRGTHWHDRLLLEGHRMKNRIAVITAVLATALPALTGSGGGPAPQFTLAAHDGRAVSLAQYHGQGVSVKFWGSWCGPFRHGMPL